MQILVDETRCSGCRACELACVAHHEGRFGTATARIRISKVEAHGVDRPSVCRQCADAPCVEACPVGALQRHAIAGTVTLTAADCIVCPACADACSFDALFIDAETGMPLICDFCGGDPACVKRCVTGALTMAPGLKTGGPTERFTVAPDLKTGGPTERFTVAPDLKTGGPTERSTGGPTQDSAKSTEADCV
jgi:Fe-S-cluster-containing dehydrogenase component